MFRYSLRTLLIGITAIAVFLAVGLPWLRKRETIVLGMLGEESLPTIVELDPLKKEQQDTVDMYRRRGDTRRWMTKQGFRLVSDTSPATSDRFVGELPNCGETKVNVNYLNESAELNIEVEANLPLWVWESSPVVPNEMHELLDQIGLLIDAPLAVTIQDH